MAPHCNFGETDAKPSLGNSVSFVASSLLLPSLHCSMGEGVISPSGVNTKLGAAPKKKKISRGLLAGVLFFVLAGAGLGVGLGIGLGGSKSNSWTGGHYVQMAFTAAGTVDDFTNEAKTAIEEKVATEVGVYAASKVTLTVEAASVLLSFIIEVDSASAATWTASFLAAQMGDTSAASIFLTTTALAVIVEEINTLPTWVDGDGGGDGYTYDDQGARGNLEYLARQAPLESIGAAVLDVVPCRSGP